MATVVPGASCNILAPRGMPTRREAIRVRFSASKVHREVIASLGNGNEYHRGNHSIGVRDSHPTQPFERTIFPQKKNAHPQSQRPHRGQPPGSPQGSTLQLPKVSRLSQVWLRARPRPPADRSIDRTNEQKNERTDERTKERTNRGTNRRKEGRKRQRWEGGSMDLAPGIPRHHFYRYLRTDDRPMSTCARC